MVNQRHNSSSIEGGIFGTEPAPLPSSRPTTANRRGASSIEGGIFGTGAPVAPVAAAPRNISQVFVSEPLERPTTADRRGMTKSSVEGGIFGGYNYVEAPVKFAAPATPRGTPVETMAIAGQAIPKSEAFVFTDDAPLQPLASARANKNQSSIEGGIFGMTPLAAKPGLVRGNPNASSVAGGIFGTD